MNPNLTETLDAMKAAQASPSDTLSKAYTQATGLVAYDLQAPAIRLYPWGEMITPLRNMIPRVAGGGDTATRWKAITGINTANLHPGISEGNRGAVATDTVSNYTAAYIGLGLEQNVSFEADLASQGFDDVKARAVEGSLRALMIQEEKMLFGGNGTLSLGTTPTPTASAAGSGATLPAATYSIICVALTHDGYLRSSLSGGIPQQLTKTNADGTTDTINGGAAQKSAAASQAITLGQTLSVSVAAVRGAVGYAWYVGTAGSEKLEAITAINSVAFSAPLLGTGQAASSLASADYSKDATYNMDGLLYFAFDSTGNAYYKALATGTAGTGSTLTSDGAGGIIEINDMLQNRYDNYRVSPDTFWVSSQDIRNINKKVIGGGGTPLFRFNMDANTPNGELVAGAVVGSYLNPITNQLIKVRVHPYAIPGTILATAKSIPYPLSGVGNVFQVKTRREYYQLEWPLRTRKYEYGVYADEVLQHYAPFTLGVITNVANG